MHRIEGLQASFNDLIDVLALSGMWAGIEPEQIRDSLLKDLIRRLGLEFAAARLSGNSPLSSAAVLRTAWTGDRGLAACGGAAGIADGVCDAGADECGFYPQCAAAGE